MEQNQTGSEMFVGATATSSGEAFWSNILIVPTVIGSDVSVDAHFTKGIVAPATSQVWWAGFDRAEGHPMTVTHETLKGNPVLQADRAGDLLVVGDFTIHVWQPIVEVAEPGAEPRVFRTGEWHEPVSDGAPGASEDVAYEAHFQLLSLKVDDGELRLRISSGYLFMEAPALVVATDGEIAFDAERVDLRSGDRPYAAANEQFKLEGAITLRATPSTEAYELLQGEITGSEVTTDLVAGDPDFVVTSDLPNAGSPPEVEPQNALSMPGEPRRDASLLLVGLFWALAVIAVLSVVAWRLSRRAVGGPAPESSAPVIDIIAQAEAAFIRGDGNRAREIVQIALAKEPTNPDAWFVHGASLIRDGMVDQAVKDITPVAKKSKT
ncbi:MAG TPA: hypothetical protein VGB18_00330, partial [Candidatus Thermoplasmatota archaeon]